MSIISAGYFFIFHIATAGSSYKITRTQIEKKIRVIGSASQIIPINQITDIGMSQTNLQKLVDTGTIKITAASEKEIEIVNIKDSERVYRMIQDLIKQN